MRWSILVLFFLGCDDMPSPVSPVSTCYMCSPAAVACATTLDDCISQGHGTCNTGNYRIASDGVTNAWVDNGGDIGNWSMVDRDIELKSAASGQTTVLRLYLGRDGETCP